MDFDYSEKTETALEVLRHFMNRRVLPVNLKWHQSAARGEYQLAVIKPLNVGAGLKLTRRTG
jgi:acyl-CoA dehydrogenase